MERPGEERASSFSPGHEIHRGRRFVVTRAPTAASTQPAAALVEKTVEADHQDASTVAALIHEAAVLKRVEAPGVERFVDLRTVRALPVLVVEDAGAATLHDRTQRPFDVATFLDLAIRLAEIVAHVHACDILHLDINPSNIVLDAGGAPTLVDFDRAAAGSTAVPGPRDEVAGEAPLLSYASPEQLGRTSRVLDRRSDLYSLGSVFYEMLTGAPPFRSDDPLELVHAHLVRVPVSPSVVAAGVPGLLSGIVLKLLSKAPELRYQSAAALGSDLREARARWLRKGAIEPFELGSLDVALQLPIADRLYGRGHELAALRAAYARVARGGKELVLISGDAGIGKSALARAFRQEVVGVAGSLPKGRFFSGKSDARAVNVPFAPLLDALEGMVEELAREPGEPGESREASRARILHAVGADGRVLTELLPELETIIGRQPPLAPLEPFEAQTRLYVTLQAFVQAFATEERPLVLFLDDLQWADAASLDALRALAADPESKHLMLLGAFRLRDPAGGQALARFEEELRRGRIAASRVDLEPLSQKAVKNWLGEALQAEASRAAPLAELLAAKSGGNPFFFRQLLMALHRSGQLSFDLQARRWTWSLPQIERVGITENVVELIQEAIRRLPDETRALLPVASCGGNVDLELLARAAERPVDEVRAALEPALRERLLEVDPETGEARFVHHRVQDAACSMLGAQGCEELHLRVGRVLAARAGAGFADASFEALGHLNAGARRLRTDGERLDLVRLNHRAGLKAKAVSAFGPALAYLRAGLEVLPAGAWEAEPELAMALHREAAECAYLSGEYALSDRLVGDALARAAGPVQRAGLRALRVASATSRLAWREALDEGVRALAELGYSLPSDGGIESAIAEEERACRELLRGAGAEALLDVPLIVDPADRDVLRLLAAMAHPAWWSRDRGLFRLLSFRTLRFIIERGHGPESLPALCDVAVCLSAQDQFEAADTFGAVAQELAWRFSQPAQKARSQFLYTAFVQRWRQPYASLMPRLLRAYESARKAGEMRAAAYSLSARAAFAFASGQELDAILRDLREDMPVLRRARCEGTVASHACYRQACRCLKGLTAGRNQFAEPAFDEDAFLQGAEVIPSVACLYWTRRLHTSVVFRDFVAAHGYAQVAGELIESMAGFMPAADFLPYSSLCLAALCETGPAAERAGWLAKIAQNQRRLACWAESCPENFKHLYLLVEAEVARLHQRLPDAADLYEQAIELAAGGGFVHDAAVASELAGRHALSRGRIRIGDLYVRKARERYARWGASEKVRALEEEFPELGRSNGAMNGARMPDLDLVDLLKKSAEAISTEVVLDRLLERLVRVCAEAAGADRVAVILEEDGRAVLRASGTATGPVEQERSPLGDDGVRAACDAIEQARSTGRPMVVEDAVHDPRLASDPYVRSRAPGSILALPVQRGAVLVATLYFESAQASHAFTGPRLHALELLSAHIVAALENSRLFEKLKCELTERRRAEDSVRFLADAATELSETLDAAQIAERLVRLVVPAMADWCCVDMVDDTREIRRLACRHRDPEKAGVAEEFLRKGVPDWSSPQPPSVVLRSGVPFLIEDIDDQTLYSTARDPEHLRMVRELGARSVLAVPMIAHGRTVGAITLVAGKSHRYGPGDVAAAQELARRAAPAIDNARLFQQAQDAIRLREEFLSVAAHELHTPITSLHLMMQALSGGGVPVTPETVRQTFGVADRQVRRLIRLIDELLDVTRIEAHRLHLDLEPLDLTALVREVAERFSDDASRSGTDLYLHLEEPVLGVWDRGRLERVVSNLLSNAMKFGNGRPIDVAVTGGEGRAKLSVVDRGIGVPPERATRIFDRFERGVSTRQYAGLGLGLYIVRTIVETHGGTVHCEDTPGGGATFVVNLPCEPSSATLAAASSVAPAGDGASSPASAAEEKGS